MEVIIKPDSASGCILAAKMVARLVKTKPDCVLGLATGSTPMPMYRELVRMHKEEGLDFSRVKTFNLDEYVGLPPDHPQSYHNFMNVNFFNHVNVAQANIHIPDGMARNIPAHCVQYEERIREVGGIDLQVLGLGLDGHIGFNEPTSALSSRTRIKTLTPKTVEENAKNFKDSTQVPRHVITMGVGTIQDARQCLMMAFGERKAGVVAKMVEGPITAMIPASALQLHRNAIAIIDEQAARGLTMSDYFRTVYANKPAWQKCE
jgi:glucosamine-6-phosphate deaminase